MNANIMAFPMPGKNSKGSIHPKQKPMDISFLPVMKIWRSILMTWSTKYCLSKNDFFSLEHEISISQAITGSVKLIQNSKLI